MPKYDVVMYYHASVTYTVEADDHDGALAEARRQNEEVTDEALRESLTLDLEKGDEQVFEMEEEVSDA